MRRAGDVPPFLATQIVVVFPGLFASLRKFNFEIYAFLKALKDFVAKR